MKTPTTLIALSIITSIVIATNGFVSKPDAALAMSIVGAKPEAPAGFGDTSPGAMAPVGPGIHGADDAAEAEIMAAIERFVDAGLPLPELSIHVHESAQGCNGHQGLFGKGGDKHRIDICVVHPSVIRHELAHLWEHHNVDDATRQAFLDSTGLEAWNDQSAVHRSRGIEQAAYLVAWGIAPEPIQSMLRSFHGEDLANFELLTGEPSPRIAHSDDVVASTATATGHPIVPAGEVVSRSVVG